MPRYEFEQELAVRNAIKEYLNTNVMTRLRDIQDYVEKKTGIRPADSTVSNLIQDLGYKKLWVKED